MTEHVLPPRRARSNRLPDLDRQTAWNDIRSWIPRLKFNWESFFALAAVSVGGVAVYSLYGEAISDPGSNAAVWLGKDYLNVLPPVAPLVPRPDAGIVDPTPTKLSPPVATRIVTISDSAESPPTAALKPATPAKLPPETTTLVPATDVPTPEKVYACGITESKLNSYKGGILSEGHFTGEYGHSYDMGVTFTDKFISRDVVDPVSGSVVAKIDLTCAVTKDDKGNKKIVYIVTQAERLDKPDVNVFWTFTLDALHGFPIDATSYMTNPDKSLHDPAEIIPGLAGRNIKILFPLDNTIGRGDAGWISNKLFLDPDYGKKLKELVTTKGGSIDNNEPPIIWLRGWDAWGW